MIAIVIRHKGMSHLVNPRVHSCSHQEKSKLNKSKRGAIRPPGSRSTIPLFRNNIVVNPYAGSASLCGSGVCR